MPLPKLYFLLFSSHLLSAGGLSGEDKTTPGPSMGLKIGGKKGPSIGLDWRVAQQERQSGTDMDLGNTSFTKYLNIKILTPRIRDSSAVQHIVVELLRTPNNDIRESYMAVRKWRWICSPWKLFSFLYFSHFTVSRAKNLRASTKM